MKRSTLILFLMLLGGCITNSGKESRDARYPVAIYTEVKQAHPNDEIAFTFQNNADRHFIISQCTFRPYALLQKQSGGKWLNFESYACVAIGSPIDLPAKSTKTFTVPIPFYGNPTPEVDGTYRMKFTLYYTNSEGKTVFLDESKSVSNDFEIVKGPQN